MRALLPHLVLAVIGLALAFWTWNKPVEEVAVPGQVTLFQCREGSVRELRYVTEDRDVKLEEKRDNDESYYWITSKREPRTPPNGQAEAERTERQFTASSERTSAYLKSFAPLRAARSIGNVNRELLATFELAEPKRKLSVRCGLTTHSLDLGARLPSDQYYARLNSTGPVYLLDDALISKIAEPEDTLIERMLHEFAVTDVESIAVKARGRELRLLHRNRRDPRTAEWVDASAPDQRNEQYGNWLDRITRMAIAEYLPPGREPGSDLATAAEVATILRLDFAGEGKANGAYMDFAVAQKPEGQGAEFYVRTETTRTWARIGDMTGSEPAVVARDIGVVMGDTPAE